MYSGFAGLYDEFMDNVPYEKWRDRIVGTLARYGIRDGLLCELGCGTGTMTGLLKKSGFDMIGIDSSEEMLSRAFEKETAEGGDRETADDRILYLCQDIRDFELYGTVRAFYSVCNTMNYLLTEEDFIRTLLLVNNYLDPGGIFFFDINTDAWYRKIGDTVAENREDASFIWENEYDPATGKNEYRVTFFEREKENGLFRKFTEIHTQRAWTEEEIRGFAEKAGMRFLRAEKDAADTDASGRAGDAGDAGTLFITLMENGKEKSFSGTGENT